MIKVILNKDVPNLGQPGDIVGVADGYATNYLVPRGLAMRATKGAQADADALKRSRIRRDARTLSDAEQLRERLQARPIVITARAGQDGTLFGSVGNREVAAALSAQAGLTVDRRRIPLEHPIKHVGRYEVPLKLHSDVTATISVDVVGGS